MDFPSEWCSDCRISIAHTSSAKYCQRCGRTLGPHQQMQKGRCPWCQNYSFALDAVCRIGVYQDALANAIVNLKYHHDMFGITSLTKLLAGELTDQEWFDEAEALCPIPAHWTRRVKRGFNQSAIIANQLGKLTGKPVIPLIKRIKPTLPQPRLSAASRAANVKDAFAVKGRWHLALSNVCLVDDVMTTGATLNEAARILKRAGAKNVFAAVFARAENIAFS